MGKFNSGKFSSDSTEWGTPDSIWKPLDSEFHFTLDVCATSENAKCQRFISKEDDALTKQWEGSCWMNPPYGRQMIQWLKKALQESKRGVVTVALILAKTNTGWWHDIIIPNCEVRFVRGRPKFNNAKHGLPFPLAVVIFR